jgi:hypothetical protein
MSDDLERRLEAMYRALDGSARRVESGWRTRPGTRRRAPSATPPSFGAWLGAGVAAAAAILLIVMALRSEKQPLPGPVVQVPFVTIPEPPPRRDPEPPPSPGAAPRVPVPAPLPVETPRPPEPKSVPQTPGEGAPPSTPPAPATPTTEPKKPEPPPPTRVVRAVAVLREAEGAFDLVDRPLRGKQKDLAVAAGDRLRTSTTVKITLADDRTLLLAPRTVVEFRPEEKRLALSLEQGELLADLIGPGPEIRVLTRTCEVTPLGTVFSVKLDAGRTGVTVEKGRVEVQSARAKATLRAAEAIRVSEDGALGPAGPADFRGLAWARSHRAPELTLFAEDFSKPGAWEAEVDKGVARAQPRPGSGPLIHLSTEKPIFEVPVRGAITLVYRADRASKLKIQLYAGDVKTTYRADVAVNRGSDWRTLTIPFDEFVPSDRTKATGRPAPGAPVSDLLMMYGEEDERGSFWLDSIKVTEVRP